MKRYIPRATTPLAMAVFICGIHLLAGIVLAFVNIENIGLPIGMILLGGLLGVIFLCCYFAERSRYLIIDTDQIVFPRGAEINGKTSYQRTVVRICDILSLKSTFHKGDKIISGDTSFYTVKLKNGTTITFTLYAYGKEAEDGIIDTIKRSIT